jgi:hypothetical protein
MAAEADKLVKRGMISQLIVLPEPVYHEAMELIERKHLEAMGWKWLDQYPPAQDTPEG